jgi:hypothetical protein
VRDAFNSEVTANVIIDLKVKNRLHVDIAGQLSQEVGYMLLGLRSPAEFFGNLMLSGTDEQTARAIMQEVNDRIFIPLKQQVVDSGRSPVPEGNLVRHTQPSPRPAPEVPPPALEYQPSVPITLPGSPIPAPMQTSSVSIPAETPVPELINPAVALPPPTPALQMTNPGSSVRTLASAVSAHEAAPAVVGRQAAPISKEYAADPYREPI